MNPVTRDIRIPTGAELHDYWAAEPPSGPYVKRPAHQSMYLSEIGGCQRKVFLRLNRFPAAPFSATSQAAMAKGIAFERYVQLLYASWCAKRGIGYSRQTKVSTPYGNGKLDLWIPGINHIVEVKTTESKGKDWLPRQSHVDQVLMYLTFYTGIDHSAVPGVEVAMWQPTAELCYALWDSGEVISYPIEYENYTDRISELLKWCEDEAEAIKLGIMPPTLDTPSRFPCGWRADNELGYDRCQYWSNCYAE